MYYSRICYSTNCSLQMKDLGPIVICELINYIITLLFYLFSMCLYMNEIFIPHKSLVGHVLCSILLCIIFMIIMS